MSPAEVLGVELQQFAQGEHIAYVPRVVGQTAAAASAKSTGVGQFWTKETFLDAASARVSDAEMRLINRLFTDVDSRGVKLNWGKGITPGVAGWYSVAGRPTGLWALNANTDSPTSKAYLQIYLADLPSRVGPDVMERAASELERIPTLKAKLADARTNNWKKYPSLYLVDVAGHADQEQALLAAITVLITDSSAQPVGGA